MYIDCGVISYIRYAGFTVVSEPATPSPPSTSASVEIFFWRKKKTGPLLCVDSRDFIFPQYFGRRFIPVVHSQVGWACGSVSRVPLTWRRSCSCCVGCCCAPGCHEELLCRRRDSVVHASSAVLDGIFRCSFGESSLCVSTPVGRASEPAQYAEWPLLEFLVMPPACVLRCYPPVP